MATFFTFLPSFLFILVGAPMVEATRHDLKFTAPLTGITAAVVGVILNLAVFFAWHVLWPEATEATPFSGRFEWFSLLVTGAAFVALWRYKIGIIPVIAACAAAGLGYSLLVSRRGQRTSGCAIARGLRGTAPVGAWSARPGCWIA